MINTVDYTAIISSAYATYMGCKNTDKKDYQYEIDVKKAGEENARKKRQKSGRTNY